jgi:hypothetical protein
MIGFKDICFQLFALFGAGSLGYFIAKPLVRRFLKFVDRLAEKVANKRMKAKNQVYCKQNVNQITQGSGNTLTKKQGKSEDSQDNNPLNENIKYVFNTPFSKTFKKGFNHPRFRNRLRRNYIALYIGVQHVRRRTWQKGIE